MRAILKAPFAYSPALCGDAHSNTISNHVGSEGRDPLDSEIPVVMFVWTFSTFFFSEDDSAMLLLLPTMRICPLSY